MSPKTADFKQKRHIPDALKNEIKAEAARRIVDIADHFLLTEYPARKRASDGVEYARKKGQARTWEVSTAGRYAGWAKDYRGENHDAPSLVRHFHGGDYLDALHWLADFLNIPLPDNEHDAQERAQRWAEDKAKRDAQRADEEARQERIEAEEEARHLKNAAAWLADTSPLELNGTADRYLTQTRGIPRSADGWPSCLTWHAKTNTLSAGLADDNGTIRKPQRIPLDPNTFDRARNADGEKLPRLNWKGSRSGLFVRMPNRLDVMRELPHRLRPLILAEGPETALALWSATGCETWARISASAKAALSTPRLVIFARDDDSPTDKHGNLHPAYKAADDAIADLKRQGCAVVEVWPHQERRGDGSDFNDTIKEGGVEAVRQQIRDALPKSPPPTQPIDHARKRLTNEMRAWLGNEGADAPAILFPVGVGIGKTQTALTQVSDLRARLNAAKDGAPEKAVYIFAPMHVLAEDMLKTLSEIAPEITAKVWKGRARKGMCGNEDAVNNLLDARLPVKPFCTTQCPLRDTCRYLRQAEGDAPDVWIMTHDMLFLPKPSGLPAPSLVIVDENFKGAGLFGLTGEGTAVDTLCLSDKLRARFPGLTVQEVANRCQRVQNAFDRAAQRTTEKHKKSALTLEDMKANGFSASEMQSGIDQTADVLNWIINKHPSPREIKKWGPDRVAVLRILAILREVKRAFDDGEQTIHRLTVQRDSDGILRRRLVGRKDISESWNAPTMLLDATANPEIVRLFYPDVEIAEPVQAETPHATHIFVPTAGMGVSRQKNDTKAKAEEMRLIAWKRHILSGGGSGLIVCNKAVHEHFDKERKAKLGCLPPNWSVEHFKNTTGRNDWREVDCVEIFGRPLMSVETIESEVIALTGKPSASLGNEGDIISNTGDFLGRRHCTQERPRFLTNGAIVNVPHYYHPDLMASAILRENVEGELIQCAGRARAVNRTAKNPVEIRIHGDTYPGGLPLDAVEAPAPPSPFLKMLVGPNGLLPVLFSPTDAAKAHGAIWTNAEAAKKAFQRAKVSKGTFSLEYYYKGNVPLLGREGVLPSGLLLARYQKAAKGQKWQTAIVPEDMKHRFPGWLGDKLGCAVRVEWVDMPPPEPEPPPVVEIDTLSDDEVLENIGSVLPQGAVIAPEERAGYLRQGREAMAVLHSLGLPRTAYYPMLSISLSGALQGANLSDVQTLITGAALCDISGDTLAGVLRSGPEKVTIPHIIASAPPGGSLAALAAAMRGNV